MKPQPPVFEENDTERVMMCRCNENWRMGVQIENMDGISLMTFQMLCHEAEKQIVRQTADNFPHLCKKHGKPAPTILPLTRSEWEILMADVFAQPHIKREENPFDESNWEEYRGMRLEIFPNAETKRREMIES